MSKDILNVIKTIFKSPLYIPHCILYQKNRIIIAHDINSYSGFTANILSFLYLISNDEYFNTLFFHRIKKYKIRKFLIQQKSSFTIPYDVNIGENPIFDHPFSTILNAKSIGSHFRCKNNVTIGNVNDDDWYRPTLGDNVYVGANAVVVGNIHIGNNVTIGAGAVVVKDVPDNSIVVGNPARIIKK